MPKDDKKKSLKSTETDKEEGDETVITVKASKKAEVPTETTEEKQEPSIKFEGVPGESDYKPEIPAEDKKVSSFSLLDADKVSPEEKEKAGEPIPNESLKTPSVPDLPVGSQTGKPSADTITTDEVKNWVGQEQKSSDEVILEDKPKKGFKIFIFILILAVISGAVAGGFYYYNTKVSKTDLVLVNRNTQPTKTPEATPEPTKTNENVDFSKYSLQILNGSGVPGEAGKVNDLLSSLKFKDVKTSNAVNYDFENTTIETKSNVPSDAYDQIKKLLDNNYTTEFLKEYLSGKSTYDIVITVGVRK